MPRLELRLVLKILPLPLLWPFVRRAFLCGDDAYLGKNYDHRVVWVESLLFELEVFLPLMWRLCCDVQSSACGAAGGYRQC